ncbi:MAG TPA: hypothetical protein DD381_00535 [Lentisphaeria bacterium]|nr:MAG: hypothetical protein A2X47_05005 [Lentisphaerae bacterium GWF2_38_69]HBM14829.1 hypothetical protein [Lentisphaeria bacterium]
MKKILIIDDEPIIISLLTTLLESKGFSVLSALKGKEGMAMAENNMPGLIILDYHLPDFNGMEVYCMLKGNPRTQNIPVFLFTANTYEEDIGKLRKLGCRTFEKPIKTKEFIKEIYKIFS